MKIKLLNRLLLIVLTFILTACNYSFKGSLPSHLNTIAIPLFDDQRAQYPGVRENLTDMVINEFITDNTLKVVDESKADLILNGAITSINQSAAAVTTGEQVEQYKITVSVKVKCEDVKLSKVLYDKSISHYGLMDAQGGPDEIDNAIEEALVQITDDILNSTLGAW